MQSYKKSSRNFDFKQNMEHQAYVCIICNKIIIGIAKMCSLEKETILKHRHRLSVDSYNE